MSAIPLRKTVFYPDSDGQPMADNDRQYRVMTDLRNALEAHYAGDSDVYVSGNLFIYYAEGDPGKSISPDVFVIFGVPKGDRRSYFLWEEGRVPTLAIEIASQTGWQQLLAQKKKKYEQMGIEEYVVFDPDGEFIQPRLQGFLLERGRYRPLSLEPDGSLASRTTGLRFEPEGVRLRVLDIATGERFPWPEESTARAREAEARARAAEEELARLRAEIERRKTPE